MNTRSIVHSFAIVALLCHPVVLAHAGADEWLGRKVVTRVGIPLTDEKGNPQIPDGVKPEDQFVGKWCIYIVIDEQGERLHLKDRDSGDHGWAPTQAVVRLEDAADYFTEEIKKQKTGDLLSWRGFVYLETGHLEKARDDCSEAISLEPGEASYFMNRGTVWDKLNDKEKALSDYSKAIELNPRLAMAYCNRGTLYSEAGDLDKAIKDFDEAIRLDPGYAGAYSNRGVVWNKKKEYARAKSDFDSALNLDSKLKWTYFSRAINWIDQKDYKNALDDLNQALRLDPDYAGALAYRVVCYKALKKYDKAIADLKELVVIEPQEWWGFEQLGFLLATLPDAQLRDGKQALKYATRGCELAEWKIADCLMTLAAAYAELGEFDKAIEWHEKARKFSPFEEPDGTIDLYRAKTPLRLDQ